MVIEFMHFIPKDIQILIWAFILFLGYLHLNYWIFKKKGPGSSPILMSLMGREYNLTFGLVVASPYLIAVIMVSVFYASEDLIKIPGLRLVLGVMSIYLILSILFNLWGQKFLKSRGINPKPEGWKGFWQRVKEYGEKCDKTDSPT